MIGVCDIDSCHLIARVATSDVEGAQRRLCVMHWRAAQVFVPDELRTARLVPLPLCFVHLCKRNAVTIVGRYDEIPRPVCQRHLDDLSWVDLPQELIHDRNSGRG